jgi:hypothetical protein
MTNDIMAQQYTAYTKPTTNRCSQAGLVAAILRDSIFRILATKLIAVVATLPAVGVWAVLVGSVVGLRPSATNQQFAGWQLFSASSLGGSI